MVTTPVPGALAGWSPTGSCIPGATGPAAMGGTTTNVLRSPGALCHPMRVTG